MREATCGPGRGYLYRHMQRGACGRSRASLKGAIKSPVLIRHLQGCCQRPERTLSTERFLGSNGTDPAGASLDFEQNRSAVALLQLERPAGRHHCVQHVERVEPPRKQIAPPG